MSDDQKKQQPGSKPELSTEARLLIAFALMGLVLFATPYFFKTIAPPPPAKNPLTSQPQPAAAPAPAPSEPAEAAAPATAPVQPVAAQKEETFVVETNLYRVVFSNRGAIVLVDPQEIHG